jgi:hypothetical protein
MSDVQIYHQLRKSALFQKSAHHQQSQPTTIHSIALVKMSQILKPQTNTKGGAMLGIELILRRRCPDNRSVTRV